ncbi:NAD(P)-dependent oxidoreductase, partial [Bartonella sp. AC67GZZY]
MKILIPDDYQKATLTLQSITKLMKSHEVLVINNLAKECDLEDKLKEIDILILIRERTTVDRDLLLKLPNLKLICQTGPIGSHIDIEACRDLGIKILDGGGDPTSAAEFAWLLIMSARRKLYKSVSDMKKGRWQTTFGNQMKGATLGIFGFGRIGKMVAQYAQAFGMSILVYGSERSTQEAKNLGYHFTHSKDEFFTRPDVISVHLRLSDKTREIIKL